MSSPPLSSECGTKDSQGQNLALAFKERGFKGLKVLPLLSEAEGSYSRLTNFCIAQH